MNNILIVDDDRNIREALLRFVRVYQAEKGIELMSYQAENGQKAIEVVCSQPVDIIFADIKMPVCSGLQMMERLRELGYSGQIVIISGFDEYDLIRSSMKLGAEDYLLKPVVQEEFWTILGECLERVARTRKNHEDLFYPEEHSQGILKTIFRQQHSLEQLLTDIGTDHLLPNGAAFLCVVDLFRKRTPDDIEKETAYLRFWNIAKELFGEEVKLYQGFLRDVWVLAFLAPVTAEAPQKFRARMRKESLRFGITEHAVTDKELPAAFSQCIDKLNQFFYDIPDLFTAINEPFPYENTMKAIESAVCSCDFVLFSGYLSQLFATLCREKPALEKSRRLLLSIIYRVMSRNNEFISVIGQYKFSENDIAPYIEEATSAMELRRKMIELFNLYIQTVKTNRISRDSYNVQKTRKFLETEYTHDVSLKDISKKLGIHPNYLSTIFRSETGITYTQYLRSIRIKKASEMMHDTSLKIYEIAEKVGYEDTASFYRVFKEEMGISPKKYKKISIKTDDSSSTKEEEVVK